MAAAITTCFEIRIELAIETETETETKQRVGLILLFCLHFSLNNLTVIWSFFVYKPTVGQLIPSILMAELDVLDVCDDSDTLDGTSDVNGSDDI